MREFADAAEDGISSVRRKVELLRRELTVLREDVGLERGLDLHDEVTKARRQVPKMPAIEARLRAEAHIAKGRIDAEQASLRRGFEATKRTVAMLRARQSNFHFNLERWLTGSQTSEVEYQSSEGRGVIRQHMHPDAARALRDLRQRSSSTMAARSRTELGAAMIALRAAELRVLAARPRQQHR